MTHTDPNTVISTRKQIRKTVVEWSPSSNFNKHIKRANKRKSTISHATDNRQQKVQKLHCNYSTVIISYTIRTYTHTQGFSFPLKVEQKYSFFSHISSAGKEHIIKSEHIYKMKLTIMFRLTVLTAASMKASASTASAPAARRFFRKGALIAFCVFVCLRKQQVWFG